MKNQESRIKRLFLFAGYNQSGTIDPALVYYLREINKFGDTILCMDSDCKKSELRHAKPYTLHTISGRHGEYDFGSYKRAYIWATKNLSLSDYDFVYLINDSVYGPLYPMDKYFEKMESGNNAAFGLVCNPHPHHPHIQSWFIGTRPIVFQSDWFDTFMRAIKKLPAKGEITRQYEQGFTKLLIKRNLPWACLYYAPGRRVYNKIKLLFTRGMPFMKKVAFIRNSGALGRQIMYVLSHISPDARDAILTSAASQYGEHHVKKLLTRNPIKIVYRKLCHAYRKLFIEGI